MDTAVEKKHVESTPGTCGGAPRITGTRIRVSQIVLLNESGASPDQILAAYPHLKLSDIYAALAYYYDHREAIDSEIRRDEETYARARADLTGMDAQDVSSISS